MKEEMCKDIFDRDDSAAHNLCKVEDYCKKCIYKDDCNIRGDKQ